MAENLTANELECMMHALRNQNIFGADPGSADHKSWHALAKRGLAECRGKVGFSPDIFYSVSREGRELLCSLAKAH